MNQTRLLIGAAALAFIAACVIWFHFHNKRVIAEYEKSVTKDTEARATTAASAASSATAEVKNDTELRNEQARAAAATSDDPLRDGLDQLRRGSGPHRPPAH